MLRIQAAVAIAIALGLAPGAPAAAPLVITAADSGKTFTVMSGTIARLRLSDRWRWTAPRVSGSVMRLVAVHYRTNPGYREWEIRPVASGQASIRSLGLPSCRSCTLGERRFRVLILVP